MRYVLSNYPEGLIELYIKQASQTWDNVSFNSTLPRRMVVTYIP